MSSGVSALSAVPVPEGGTVETRRTGIHAPRNPGAGSRLEVMKTGRHSPGAPGTVSGSEADSESGEEDEAGGWRPVKRERMEPQVGVAGAKPGKKTRGRVKIKMEFIDNKLRRYTTFSKRKTGIMKKAYELSTLTGTQVLLLVASETGHVYTFATRKLQPMITSETGKALIQTCLNSPDSPPRPDSSSDQRMSATGFEETDLSYQVSETDGLEPKDLMKQNVSTDRSSPSPCSSSASLHTQSAPCWPVVSLNSQSSSNGDEAGLKAGVVQLPTRFALMSSASMSQQNQTVHIPTTDSSPEMTPNSSSTTVSSSMAGHVMYPGAVMYAANSTNFTQHSHTLLQDSNAVPQMFLAGSGTVQIPVSAVPLHSPPVASGGTLTELRVVNLENTKGD
ncbi:serum response factor-like isoform X2 [Hoplias malabaricus]|uniref:serum response factor-like isoform X2 n=1 Tax=Hoplias malabaricus TaxID=27720 RepID=UPI003462993E